jgi:hypothetical protein
MESIQLEGTLVGELLSDGVHVLPGLLLTKHLDLAAPILIL